MKVLVTGGTGFIGCNLIEQLIQRGDTVRCVAKDRMNASVLEPLGVEVILGDLTNGLNWDAILDDVEYIYHLAGVTRARRVQEYYEGNYEATKRLVEMCARYCPNVKRFVYVSSLAAVGPAFDSEPVTEETPYHPVSHYGKSKMMGELEVLRLREKLPVTIVRPSTVYGPRERDMYSYFKLVKSGIQPLFGFRKKLLNLIHSDDLIQGLLLAGMHPHAVNEIFFLGGKRSYSTEYIGTAIAWVLGCHPIRLRIPQICVYKAGIIAGVIGRLTRKQVFFNFEKAREAVQTAWICSVEKARSWLGFRECISLERGIQMTYDWYCAHGWL